MTEKTQPLINAAFMCIEGQGILIMGKPSMGKSSLALALLDRGHSLIADDAVILHKDQHILFGTCPEVSRNYLMLRDIGLIKIKQENPIEQHKIDFVIELKPNFKLKSPVLKPKLTQHMWLNIPVLGMELNAHDSHLALKIETIVKNLKYFSDSTLENSLVTKLKESNIFLHNTTEPTETC